MNETIELEFRMTELEARVAELEAEVARLLAAAAAVEVQPLSRCVACGQYYCRCET